VLQSWRLLLALAVSTLAAVAGCTDSTTPAKSGPATIKGSLTLRAVLRDAAGTTTGTRVVSEPSGIRVYLTSSGVEVDSTLTVSGVYTFQPPPGLYRLRFRTGPLGFTTSKEFSIDAQTGVVQVESYPIQSVGDLSSWPNPFVTLLNTRFSLPSAGQVALGVYDLANLRVRMIDAGSSYGQGTHVFGWDGLDDANQPAPDGAYWVVSSGPGHNWAELVFKGP
jgi:hypothetical protein